MYTHFQLAVVYVYIHLYVCGCSYLHKISSVPIIEVTVKQFVKKYKLWIERTVYGKKYVL